AEPLLPPLGMLRLFSGHAEEDVAAPAVFLPFRGRGVGESSGLLVPPRALKLRDEPIRVTHGVRPSVLSALSRLIIPEAGACHTHASLLFLIERSIKIGTEGYGQEKGRKKTCADHRRCILRVRRDRL